MHHLLLWFYMASALAALNENVDSKNNSPLAVLNALVTTQRYEDAEKLLAHLEGSPELIRVYAAFVTRNRDGTTKARLALEKALEEFPRSTLIIEHLAQLYLLEQKPGKAQAILGELPAETMQQFQFILLQSRIFIQQDPERALDFITQQLRHDAHTEQHISLLHIDFISALKAMGLEHAALKYFKNLPHQLQAQMVQEPNFLATLGAIKNSEVIPTLETLALHQPTNRVLLKALGYGYARQGLYRNALDAFKRAHALGEASAMEIADVLKQLKRPSEALLYNAQVQNKNKKLLQRFKIHLHSRQYQRAVTLIEELKQHQLLGPREHYQHAYALAQLGQDAQAIAICQQLASSIYHTEAKTLERALLQRHKP